MVSALITGGSRGIGAATALRLAREGVDVVINYHDKAARAEKIADQARALGSRARTIRADLTDPEAVRQLVDTGTSEYGARSTPTAASTWSWSAAI